jgi:hypothetical protein
MLMVAATALGAADDGVVGVDELPPPQLIAVTAAQAAARKWSRAEPGRPFRRGRDTLRGCPNARGAAAARISGTKTVSLVLTFRMMTSLTGETMNDSPMNK